MLLNKATYILSLIALLSKNSDFPTGVSRAIASYPRYFPGPTYSVLLPSPPGGLSMVVIFSLILDS